MRYLVSLILGICMLVSTGVKSQNTSKHTVSGYVKDASTGESMIGANVYVKELMKGAPTNLYGFYSVTLPSGKYTLMVSMLGYDTYSQALDLTKDQTINISLQPKSIMTKEVVITGDKVDKNITSTQMGAVKLDMATVKSLPAFMGEVDILKTIQLLPGVKSSGDGNSGFYVRGGGPDQNLILLDEAVVYNASHLFGFFSVFNGDAIKSLNLVKGGMPAQYGGRLSSVLDISMKDGNNQKFVVDGGIGLISSRLTVQGPIKKDTSSFIISGRRTYIDILTKPLVSDSSRFKGSGYYFYDLNTKINYMLSAKDRLYLSGYFGRDVFSFNNKEQGFNISIPWGNATASARWNHLFGPKLFMNTSAIFTDYDFSFGAAQNGFEFKLFSGIRDWNAKVDFGYFPSVRHEVRFGANYVYHTFTPSNVSAKSGDVEFDFGKIKKQYAHEAALYVSDDFDVTDKLKLNAGLRYSYFMQVGPFDRYVKDITNSYVIDTISYKAGQKVKSYGGLEPRLSLRYTIDKKSSIKASYTQNYQYIHLASLSGVSLPTDVWVPSSDVVNPQYGVQYATGYFRNFKENEFETSVEVYYKSMKNQVEYAEGALPENDVNDNADGQFTFGKGQSYGAEFFVKRNTGKLTGWVGYTLSYTTRKFDEINGGKEYYAKYDRRHDGSVALTYEASERWTFGAVFVYGTGNAVTLPVARYFYEDNIVNVYGPRNGYRMAPYHRLDISATLQGKKTDRFQSSWNFSVFNVYNRRNPYFIYIANEGSLLENSFKFTAKQVSLFPFLPSVTWNFKF